MRRTAMAVAIALAATAGAPLVLAQAQEKKIEKIEVTGSNIKRIDAEGPAPVLVLTREDIDKSGAQTVADLMRNLPINNVGQFAETTLGGNTFAAGTAAISLRGLGPNTTLVLLNGRRVANYGFGQNITQAFVDLNSIPPSAIERIEILKDGASAIYGSDAIAGVVNIIMKKEYQGLELSATVGEASVGDSEQTRFAITGGWGDLSRDRFNVMAVLDVFERKATWAKDREFSRNADQRARGGFDLRSPTGNPGTWLTAGRGGNADNTVFTNCPTESRGQFSGLTTCYYNFQPEVYLLPPSERKGAFVRGVADLGSALSGFVEVHYNENVTESQLAPTPANTTLPVGHNSNPYDFAVPIRYRFVDVGPRITTITTEASRLTAGLKGSSWNWDWEGAFSASKSDTASRGRNSINADALATLTANGVYNYLNNSANSAALVDSLRANPFRIAKASTRGFDFKATRELMQLPAGPVGLAIGVERRAEKVSDEIDPLSAAGKIVGAGGATSNGDRTQTSLYSEIGIPVHKTVEVQLAARMENYSDFGKATKPKIAVSWKVTPDLMLRGSYSKGFRAPSLQELYLGLATSFPSFIDTPRCTAYTTTFGPNDARTLAVCGAPQVRSQSSGNSGLKPEESESSNVGIVWEAFKGFSVSLDYYIINHTNRITQPSVQFLLSNPTPNSVNRRAQNANDVLANAPGELLGVGSADGVGISNQFQNLSAQETSGLDLDLRYRFNWNGVGKVTLTSMTSHVASFRTATSPGTPLTEFAGTYQFPRTISTNGVNLSRGDWEFGLTARTRSMFYQFNRRVHTHVDSYTTLDGQMQYSGFKNMKLVLGVNNIESKAPPFDDNSNDGYANSTDNPIGRYIYGRVTYNFK